MAGCCEQDDVCPFDKVEGVHWVFAILLVDEVIRPRNNNIVTSTRRTPRSETSLLVRQWISNAQI
jgi:hypothetical protein